MTIMIAMITMVLFRITVVVDELTATSPTAAAVMVDDMMVTIVVMFVVVSCAEQVNKQGDLCLIGAG